MKGWSENVCKKTEPVRDVRSLDSVEYAYQTVSTDELYATKKGDWFKHSCLFPGIVVSVRPKSPREIRKDQAKEKSGKQTYTD